MAPSYQRLDQIIDPEGLRPEILTDDADAQACYSRRPGAARYSRASTGLGLAQARLSAKSTRIHVANNRVSA